MDQASRRAQPPVGLSSAPPGMPGQREIEFFRLVRMGGIFGVAPEQQNAAGDRVALERSALGRSIRSSRSSARNARRSRRSNRSAASRDCGPAPRRPRPTPASQAQRIATGLRARKRREACAPLAAARSAPAASREGRVLLPARRLPEVFATSREAGAGSRRAEHLFAWAPSIMPRIARRKSGVSCCAAKGQVAETQSRYILP